VNPVSCFLCSLPPFPVSFIPSRFLNPSLSFINFSPSPLCSFPAFLSTSREETDEGGNGVNRRERENRGNRRENRENRGNRRERTEGTGWKEQETGDKRE
jgi:hypothetical protein